MTHRASAWYREGEATRPLMKVSCQLCDYVGLSANPQSLMVSHQGERHFGRAMSFNVTKWQKPTEAAPNAS